MVVGTDWSSFSRILRAPSGVYDKSYGSFARTRQIDTHRSILASQHPRIPRTVWWPIQGLSLVGWLASIKKEVHWWLQNAGPELSANFELDVREIEEGLLHLARAHGIRPRDAIELGLVHRERWEDWPNYVYNVEAGAFNALRSRRWAGDSQFRSDALKLADKVAAARHISIAGGDVPRVLAQLQESPSVSAADLRLLLAEHEEVFVKPISGSRGIGSAWVRAKYTAPRFEVRPVGSVSSRTPRALRELRSMFPQGPYLVQEVLKSDEEFTRVSAGALLDVVSMRVITMRGEDGVPKVWSALLQIPRSPSTDEFLTYYAFALNPENGELSSPYRPPWLDWSTYLRDPELTTLEGRTITGWESLIRLLTTAHQGLAGLDGIGWDVALSDRGPVVIEGNTGHDVVRAQAISGPLLGSA